MKTKTFLIIALLCFLSGKCTLYAKKGYTVQGNANKPEIVVSADCKIFVADIVPQDKYVYGDPGLGGDEDELFNKNQVNPNKDSIEKKGIIIAREEGRVILKIDYNSLEDTEIKLHFAENKGTESAPDYYPSSETFSILLKKHVEGSEGLDDESSLREKEIVDNIHYKMQQPENKIDRDAAVFSFGALVWALVCACVLFVLNRKALKVLARDYANLKSSVETLKVKINSQTQQYTSLKNQSKLSDEDIKRFIVEQVKIATTQIEPVPTAKPSSKYESQTIVNEPQERDTDNVKYNQTDNSFSIEQTDLHIFRIYSKNGDYYYTIVEDHAVREELIGMLQMFEGCITYQTTNSVAKGVEPITDGKLRKEGNRFYVDNNNKLVVKFI